MATRLDKCAAPAGCCQPGYQGAETGGEETPVKKDPATFEGGGVGMHISQ
jgi:hypothetical protein